MEEKKIKVIINNETIKLESNNPDLKSLIDLILKQDNDFDFNTIEIESDDDNFDKKSFKEILVESIEEFKNKIELLEIKKTDDTNKIEEMLKKIDEKN